LLTTEAAIAAAKCRFARRQAPNARVIANLPRFPLMTGDPASSSGVLIDLTELAPDVIAELGGYKHEREVVLTFNTPVPAMTVFNIQTGAYVGGPATVTGDTTLALPIDGATFTAEGFVLVYLNGQSLTRQPGLGMGDGAQWVSSVQLALSVKLFAGDVVRVASPLPVPPPPPITPTLPFTPCC
jgi:hypothetical protein